MADDDQGGWQLTESDPGVFTELLKTLGVPLVVDDLYSLDSESLAQLQPLHALIFLFKWIPTPKGSDGPGHGGSYAPDFPGFFAHQVVNNACATLAVLNALGNVQPAPKTGPELGSLFEFSQSLDPQTRGYALTSADWLRAAHNALSPPATVSLEELGLPREKEDAYHFVVYVPKDGRVWELDGLQPYAIDHGAFDAKGQGWVALARTVIERRISTYPAGALEFNLQALRDDPIPTLEAQLSSLTSAGISGSDSAELVVRLTTEKEKQERWAFENALRRHNHLGLVHAALLALAKAGQLESAQTLAKQKMRERIAKARERGEDIDDA